MIEAKALAIASLFAERMSSNELTQACLAHFHSIMEAETDQRKAEERRDRDAHGYARARAKDCRIALERFLRRAGLRRLRVVGNSYVDQCPICHAPSGFVLNPRGSAECSECGHKVGSVEHLVGEMVRASNT